MISKDLLKSINSLIPKKAFSPALTQFMYYKEFNTFVATDSYILLEIKNTKIKYSGIQIRTGLVWISNSGMPFECQMVQFSKPNK